MIVEPLKRAEGGVVVSHLDVTRRRRAEEAVQRDREELAHALRVATMGEMATSIAHEIYQPLTAIVTNAHAASRSLAGARPGGEGPEMLGDTAAGGPRAARVNRRRATRVSERATGRSASASSDASSPTSGKGWGWGLRSAARSWRRMAGGCGRRGTPTAG